MTTQSKMAIMNKWLSLLLFSVSLVSSVSSESEFPLPGYIVHFDLFENTQEGKTIIRSAKRAGAKVVNLVPPAAIWGRPDAVAVLEELVQYISDSRLKFVVTRVDASYPPDRRGQRENYLYEKILNRRGTRPDGSPASEQSSIVVGLVDYERWMEEEAAFYAKKIGWYPNLIGFCLKPFNDIFSPVRGGLLEYSEAKRQYDLTQYTPEMSAIWHQWLRKFHKDIDHLNKTYGTTAKAWDDVPMPNGETDSRFGQPQLAYLDFVRSINDWIIDRYERCRQIWQRESDRTDVPFLWQFNGLEEEIFGDPHRPGFVGFDRKNWATRADGVGLSIYLNEKNVERSKSLALSLIQRMRTEWNVSKPVYVLEAEVGKFEMEVALPLRPKTIVMNAGRFLDPESLPRQDLVRSLKRFVKESQLEIKRQKN